MATRTVTFELPIETADAIDHFAREEHLDQGAVLSQMVESYQSLREYHDELVREGLRQVARGETVSHEEVAEMLRDLKSR